MAHDLFAQKKLHKQLLMPKKKKKEALKEYWMGLILAARSTNAALFWQLVKISPSCGPTPVDCHIHPGTWEKHFYDLYKNSDAI